MVRNADTKGQKYPHYAPNFAMKIVLHDLKLLSKDHLDARQVRTLRITLKTAAAQQKDSTAQWPTTHALQ